MEYEYPVCNLYLHAAMKYKRTQPFRRLCREYSLSYQKVNTYANNTFIKLDMDFIKILCEIFDCDLSEMLINDKKKYYELRNPEDGQAKTVGGVVYFVRNAEGLTKIGRTYNLKRRLQSLRNEPRGYGTRLLHYIESRDINVLERTLHKVFADKRIEGEWFNLTDEDINRIKGDIS